MKRVFIIHGWDGYPTEGWFPWLKNKLEKNGFIVEIPTMPDAAEPKINKWVSHLAKVVKDVDIDTYFVGHSIGCQAIMRYIESLDLKKKVGGAVFVAGWFTLMNLETDEEKEIAKPWINKSMDFNKIRQRINKFIVIFSANDPFVPIENKKLFEDRLGAKTIVVSGMGHFSGSDGIEELPSAYNAVIEIAK